MAALPHKQETSMVDGLEILAQYERHLIEQGVSARRCVQLLGTATEFVRWCCERGCHGAHLDALLDAPLDEKTWFQWREMFLRDEVADRDCRHGPRLDLNDFAIFLDGCEMVLRRRARTAPSAQTTRAVA